MLFGKSIHKASSILAKSGEGPWTAAHQIDGSWMFSRKGSMRRKQE